MNHTKNILAGFTLLVMLGLTSCLKDSPGLSDPAAGTNNVVEFQNSNIPVSYTSIYPQYTNDLVFAADTVGFNVNFDYTGAVAVAPQDITVTFSTSQAALTAFNANQGTAFVIPDPSVYTLPATAVIPKGKRSVTVRVIIKKATYDFTKSYALPLTITAASSGVISTNFGTAIYTFIARNSYDGIYAVTGTLVDAASSAITEFSTPFNAQMITAGATSIAMYDGIYVANAYAHIILSGTSQSYYGSFAPVFTFDATSGNITSVVNYYGQPASNTRFATLDPSGINKYDPTSKSFQVKYWMDQPSAIVGHRTSFNEKFTYVSPR
jgi:hypothetical protein